MTLTHLSGLSPPTQTLAAPSPRSIQISLPLSPRTHPPPPVSSHRTPPPSSSSPHRRHLLPVRGLLPRRAHRSRAASTASSAAGPPSPATPPNPHDDDLVAAATEGLARVDLSDDATVRVRYGKGKSRHAASGSGGEVDKVLDYLYRACRMTGLAVKHIDVAVSVLSRFFDPKDAASLAESSDKYAYISEEGPYPSSD